MTRFQQWKLEHEAFLRELRDTYRFWKRSPLSVIGTFVILGLIVIAIIAPLLAPYDPLRQELETLRLKATGKGSTRLELGYMRPWESVPPIETFTIQVVVQ